jgi:hypothetical protein
MAFSLLGRPPIPQDLSPHRCRDSPRARSPFIRPARSNNCTHSIPYAGRPAGRRPRGAGRGAWHHTRRSSRQSPDDADRIHDAAMPPRAPVRADGEWRPVAHLCTQDRPPLAPARGTRCRPARPQALCSAPPRRKPPLATPRRSASALARSARSRALSRCGPAWARAGAGARRARARAAFSPRARRARVRRTPLLAPRLVPRHRLQIVRFGEQLGLPGLQVTAGGCLGNCGNGPNLVLLPQGQVLRHVTTPANLAHALRAFCGAEVGDNVSGPRDGAAFGASTSIGPGSRWWQAPNGAQRPPPPRP